MSELWICPDCGDEVVEVKTIPNYIINKPTYKYECVGCREEYDESELDDLLTDI